MFTLIATGTGVAYVYSLAATLFPGLLKAALLAPGADVGELLARAEALAAGAAGGGSPAFSSGLPTLTRSRSG